MLYESDVSLEPLKGKTVAVLGFGSQGHAHALNLRDRGVRVIVSNRKESESGKLALSHGFEVLCKADAVQQADLIIFAVPDEVQPHIYTKHVAPLLRAGQALGFIHGFNIHFRTIIPPEELDVIMVAPKGVGHFVRKQFEQGGGAPCLVAVNQDATGNARNIALAWACGIGGGRGGILETNFKVESETDLFGEQVVLCGGLSALIKAAFETLVDAGYPPEIAYFECLHEVKLIADLIHSGGLTWMRNKISSTARYGDLTRGPRIVDEHVRAEMRKVLREITSGQFAREFAAECESGMKTTQQAAADDERHPIELIGQELRSKMSRPHLKERPAP